MRNAESVFAKIVAINSIFHTSRNRRKKYTEGK
jgi:hypothetical protein